MIDKEISAELLRNSYIPIKIRLLDNFLTDENEVWSDKNVIPQKWVNITKDWTHEQQI